MLKKTNKFYLNFKVLKFFLISPILVSLPFFYNPKQVKAGLEFQWDQDSNHRRLKWHQKDDRKRVRNKIPVILSILIDLEGLRDLGMFLLITSL